MRRVFLGLLMVAVVAVLAHASVPNPAVAPEDSTLAQVSEPLLLEFDFAAWAEQDAAAGMCEAQSSTETAFDVARKPKPGGGGDCGGNTCGAFQYCCNPSCGTCVYFGMSCTQQSCN